MCWWLLPFLIALALAGAAGAGGGTVPEKADLRRGFTATVLSLVVLGTVAAGLVLLAMVLLRQVCELSGRLPGYLEALPRWTELVGQGAAAVRCCPEGLRSWLEARWMGCRLSWRSCWRAWASGACGR